MAPLAVDPSTLDGAGAAVVTAGKGLGSVISTLTAALPGCSGMAGDDPAGAALGHSYDSSAARLVEAMVATGNGLCGPGDGVRMSAHNYSLAEAQSTEQLATFTAAEIRYLELQGYRQANDTTWVPRVGEIRK
jgi:hypothetical protein